MILTIFGRLLYIYLGKAGLCLHRRRALYNVGHWEYTLRSYSLVGKLHHLIIVFIHSCSKAMTISMLFMCIPSSVGLRWSISPPLYCMQNMELCVDRWPISLLIIARIFVPYYLISSSSNRSHWPLFGVRLWNKFICFMFTMLFESLPWTRIVMIVGKWTFRFISQGSKPSLCCVSAISWFQNQTLQNAATTAFVMKTRGQKNLMRMSDLPGSVCLIRTESSFNWSP